MASIDCVSLKEFTATMNMYETVTIFLMLHMTPTCKIDILHY